MRRLIHQHHDVQRITVIGERLRNEPIVVGPLQTVGQQLLEPEDAVFGFEGEFQARVARRLDHRVQQLPLPAVDVGRDALEVGRVDVL